MITKIANNVLIEYREARPCGRKHAIRQVSDRELQRYLDMVRSDGDTVLGVFDWESHAISYFVNNVIPDVRGLLPTRA